MKQLISLSVKCPQCGKSLMNKEKRINNKESIKLNIVSENDRGRIWLCSVYDCYDHSSDIELKDEEMFNFYCPFCNKSLITKEKCEICDAPMVTMNIDVGGKVVICSRMGCKNHYVAFENIQVALNKFYNEYGING